MVIILSYSSDAHGQVSKMKYYSLGFRNVFNAKGKMFQKFAKDKKKMPFNLISKVC